MTLQQALQEDWRVHALAGNRRIDDPAAAAFFTLHDECQVIFGTDTGVLDQACNDWYTLMWVDVDLWTVLRGYLR